jgi:hypothetical protein
MKVTGPSPQRPKFGPMAVHVGFMVDRVGLEQFFSQYFGFPLSPMQYIHTFTHQCYISLTTDGVIK